MAIDIPFADQSVSTDPTEGAKDVLMLVVGMVIFLAAAGAAFFGWNRIRELLGVDEQTNIPGV